MIPQQRNSGTIRDAQATYRVSSPEESLPVDREQFELLLKDVPI